MAKEFDVIIIGGGPAGIFAALELVERTGKILIVEKGKSLVDRVCPSKQRHIPCVKCQPCSIVCGWGRGRFQRRETDPVDGSRRFLG